MANKFMSFLDKIGRGFKKGLDVALPVAETAGQVAVDMFLPAIGPLFKQTVTAVATAEQNATALGQQQGSGPQKLAAVAQIMGGLIKQALADAGKQADDAAVDKYISAVVTILNAVPAVEDVAAPIISGTLTKQVTAPPAAAQTNAPSATAQPQSAIQSVIP